MNIYKYKYCKYCNKMFTQMGGDIQCETWFEKTFGFLELSYADTQTKFKRMFRESGNVELNGILCGQFDIIDGNKFSFTSNQFVKKRIEYVDRSGNIVVEYLGGVVEFENIIADIKTIHANKNLSHNSTIQVASQFNCLEMIDPSKTPEDGITIYQKDKTQGPICAMSAPAGLAYRNYLLNGGQTSRYQIDMTANLLAYLRTIDKEITWRMQNGYLMFDDSSQLKKINKALLTSSNVRKTARKYIQSGSHSNQGVCIDGQKLDHFVNHVYCSGLPIAYNNLPKDLWDGLSELFLEAMYENTLLIACENNKRSGQNRPCYLTKIGGGVFGMKPSQIARAIQRACQITASRGLILSVKLVHYEHIEKGYDILPLYPVQEVAVNSVWDDIKWIKNAI